MNLRQVCLTDELLKNSQENVNIGIRKIALFHYNDKISAIDNASLYKPGFLNSTHLTQVLDISPKFMAW